MDNPINEDAARRAHAAYSMREYQSGSATSEFNASMAEAKAIADQQKKRTDPRHHAKIDRLLARYYSKMAEHTNAGFAIESRYPSVLLTGGSGFSNRKKDKQNDRRSNHMQQYDEIQGLLDKIRSTGMGGINSDDDDAVDRLKINLEKRTVLQENMKAANAYYRKHKTCHGCPVFTPENAAKMDKMIEESSWGEKQPYPSFTTTNNGAEIRRLKQRIATLEKKAGTEYHGWSFAGSRVEINKEANRIRIFFDGKICDAEYATLRQNAFIWAPSIKAFQRKLTNNALYAARRIAFIQPARDEL